MKTKFHKVYLCPKPASFFVSVPNCKYPSNLIHLPPIALLTD